MSIRAAKTILGTQLIINIGSSVTSFSFPVSSHERLLENRKIKNLISSIY